MIHSMKYAALKFAVIGVFVAPIFAGCASVKMPDIDFLKLPEFQEDIENIGGYPDVASAPQRPEDLPTDAEWDAAARDIMNRRDSFVGPNDGATGMSDAEFEQKIRELSAKVEAYKIDDPESLSK